MKNYNLKMLEAKRDLDQRLQLERRTREDGARYARDYFRINKEKIINKALDSLISSMDISNKVMHIEMVLKKKWLKLFLKVYAS